MNELLYRDYYWLKQRKEMGYSVQEIADAAGVKYSTIRKWLKRYNLQFDPLQNLTGSNGKPPWNKGKKGYKINKTITEKHKSAIREARSGEISNFWKGGISSDRANIARWTTEQAPKVHAKYDYTCQVCGKRGGNLHTHHVAPVALKPEFAYTFDNLITLCEMCHRELHANEQKIEYRKVKEPTYVLGDGIGAIEVIDHMGHDLTVVSRARASFIQDDKTGQDVEGDYKLLNFLANNKHETPFEMCVVTFLVECPIFVARQWHRHRMWSYSEASRRYTSEDIKFYIPEEFRGQSSNNKQGSEGSARSYEVELQDNVDKAVALYNEMLDAGVAREQARMVLPSNLYTRFYATANLRSISHFIGLRSDPHAQAEIRAYSDAMLEKCKILFPVSMEALCG